jgi:hypothetical protein
MINRLPVFWFTAAFSKFTNKSETFATSTLYAEEGSGMYKTLGGTYFGGTTGLHGVITKKAVI